MKKDVKHSKDRPETGYEYVERPSHYRLFGPEDLKRFADGIDVDDVAAARGLDKDAYMYMVLKYALRKGKPGEPRSRDVKKIRRYCDIWLARNGEE